MLTAIGASCVFQVLTSPSVGNYWVVLGMVVGVLDPRMDSVLDPNNSGLEPGRASKHHWFAPGYVHHDSLFCPTPARKAFLATRLQSTVYLDNI